MARQANEFGFGIESEFLLLREQDGAPLWHEDVDFASLNEILESIPVEDLGSLEGLELEPPHRRVMPYVVEGYHVPDSEFRMVDLRPKGIEIRTPVATSLDACLQTHEALFLRLRSALAAKRLLPCALSHHPIATQFRGPQNKRRHDFWRWAMQAMTTYGPDINVSVPRELASKMDLEELELKVNAYSPAMAAFSVASPFFGGQLWNVHGEPGCSVRTWRRSVVAPSIEVHPEEDGRLEFKVFEMSNATSDYRNYFLLFLTLLLDEGLRDREDTAARIYDLGAVARHGLRAPEVRARGAALLESASRTLPQWGFEPGPLRDFIDRWEDRRTPADRMRDAFLHGEPLGALLLGRSQWISESRQRDSLGAREKSLP